MTKMIPDPFDQRIAHQGEELARLLGVMRMLALPPLRTPDGGTRRRVIEILIAPNTWAHVEGMFVEAGRIVFFHGANGHRIDYVFTDTEKIPAWRCDEEYRGPRVLHEVT